MERDDDYSFEMSIDRFMMHYPEMSRDEVEDYFKRKYNETCGIEEDDEAV